MIRKLFAVWVSFLMVFSCAQAAVYAESAEPVFSFSDDSITEVKAGSGYTISGTSLEITSAGVYRIQGSCNEGSISVAKNLTGVILILDDLILSSSTTAPIAIKKGTEAIIHLDGYSVLSDNEDPDNENSSDTAVADAFEGAAIKVKSGSAVTFCGDGSLTVNGNAKNGIKGAAESSLVFNDGTYIINSINNGIAADHSVTINGGTYTINTDNDGIKSVPEADDTLSTGQIIINGGIFTIRSCGDGIQAETLLQINNGTFDITTMSGYKDSTFDKDTMSAKGIKASGDREDIENLIEINGGSFSLNTADDAVHSDTDITITAGIFDIYTGDDGVHADSTFNSGTEGGYDRDPQITIYSSYEGLEAGTLNFYSGKYWTVASDDGINAAGGSSSGSGGGWDPFKPGQPGGGASGDYTMNFYGGNFYVNCLGDGLDSNGDLNLYGGKITVFSMATPGDNSPLDSDGTILISGAEVFGAGTNPMNERPAAGSGYSYYTNTARLSGGTVVNVQKDGTVYYSDTLLRDANYMIYAKPGLSTTPTFGTGGSVDSCKSHAWTHNWDEGAVYTEASEDNPGLLIYTCQDCGKTEYQSYKLIKDCSCEGHTSEEGGSGEEPIVNEGYAVTFICDENASVNVYYTQDYTAPDETGVTSAVSRNSTTGEPDSTGDGQVNFAVVPADGYTVDQITVDGSYKNLKGPADTGAENTYRITKVASELTVTIAVKETAKPQSIIIDPVSADLPVNEILQLSASIQLTDADQGIVWTSSDENIASVDSDGTVTALSYGKATITATLGSDPEIYAVCEIQTRFIDVLNPDRFYYTPVYWAADNAVTTGTSRSTFSPDDTCTRAQIVTFLYRAAGEPEVTGTMPFADVKLSNYFYNAVLWASENGITTGTSATSFSPNETCTRGQIVTFLWRANGSPEPKTAAEFDDVPENKFFCKAVSWAAENNITTGTSATTFSPYDSCTRGHAVTFLYRSKHLQ